ncbi:hypothetical protein HDU67_002690, partial [Dinochytrium kinnereticum]
MDFNKITQDGETFIIRSTWLNGSDDDKRKIRLNLVVMSFPLSDVWESNVSTQSIEHAKSRDSTTATLEAFETRLKYALRCGVDASGRKTESVVRRDARGRSLSLVVYPDKEGLIEFELIFIPLSETRAEKKVKVWSTCMDYLVRELNNGLNEMDRLRQKETLLQKDLDDMRGDFDRWVSTYREKSEAQVFRKFRDVLNEKKRKIRELHRALEFQESSRKRAEEELSNRVAKLARTES